MTSHYPAGSARDITLKDATRVLHAVTSARLRDHEEDAALVLAQYHLEAQSRGIPTSEAWMMLFSASANEFSDALAQLAAVRNSTPELELSAAAMAYAVTEH